MSGLIVVVGMEREARIVGDRARVVIGGADLEAALAGGARGVISFGLCGGLDPALRAGQVLVGTGVATKLHRFASDRAWVERLSAALPDATRAEFVANGEMVTSRGQKAALRGRFGAAAVDMESHLVAAAADKAGIPFAIVRAVSDPADHTLPRAAQAGFGADGAIDVSAVLAALLRRPGELRALVRTAFAASAAFAALKRCVDVLEACAP